LITVEAGDPLAPQVRVLLEANHALMQSLFPAEENFVLSLDALCSEDVHFFTARRGDVVVGVGALADRGTYGELKSMFVEEASRGQGVMNAIMRQIEDHARSLGLELLRLETGKLLHAVHKTCARHGFAICGPFGEYQDTEFSIFMQKPL